jgi:Uncharacterised protein conserved in bacteria (DUF2336)
MEGDEATRVRQGASASTSPDILRALASDPSVTVRASLALNPALPDHVSAILAADTDARVRSILSRRLSTLTPALSGDAGRRMQSDAVANLTAMVADAALRVRINLAEAVRHLPDGPRDIVLRLAHDPAVMVCEPVIRFSPMLTQEDLVTLIATKPPPTTRLAVARRPEIGEAVSDAIVDSADVAAISALLANPTAQIREATLDSLAAQSEEQTDWQAPLVRRPHLPQRAQRVLAEIVTGHLLEILAARRDLDPKVAQMLRAALGPGRSEPGRSEPGRSEPVNESSADVEARKAQTQAQALDRAGKLDDAAVLEALRRNGSKEAAAMLSVRAGVPAAVVDRACALRSAKGIVSLAWKAGMTVQTSVILQVTLAHLPPDQVLRATEDGAFPLSDDEMRWQLAFLDIPDRATRSWTPRRLGE